MFSCCRANPEKDSNGKVKNKKDKQKKNTSAQEQTTENNDKKLIIPTITIENGKPNDINTEPETAPPTTTDVNGDGDGGGAAVNGNVDGGGDGGRESGSVSPSVGEAKDYQINVQCEEDILNGDLCVEATTLAAETDENSTSKSTAEANKEVNCQTNGIVEEDGAKVTVAIHVAASEDANSPISTNDQNIQSKSSPSISTDDTNSTVIHKPQQNTPPYSEGDEEEEGEIDVAVEEDAAAVVTVADLASASPNNSPAEEHHEELPPKSCLSRHNSTHTSVKKKVNISNHAEIIEPDPLPPPPYDHPSLADDDDVFSDSLPPPKRESMCAPYIEPDEMPETATFAHGLPEWFNDERINEISGCTEPPVTPVGRDELEMKRQRLYSDLLRAAHAAVEHNVRFNPLGPELLTHTTSKVTGGESGGGGVGDSDTDLKPSVAENLEHLVNRLEKLVERLERSLSAHELEIANKTLDTVLVKKRESFDLETTDLPPIPSNEVSAKLDPAVTKSTTTTQTDQLNQRIERIETTLNKLNDSFSSSLSQQSTNQQLKQQQQSDGSLENIPTVLEDYQTEECSLPPPPPPEPEEEENEKVEVDEANSMSVLGFQDIVSGPLSQYLALSAKIGGDVAKHANLVKLAFDAQLQYVTLASQCAKPSQDKCMELLKPTSTHISAIQDFREKNRASPFFNHLSAISESIPALGWVCVSPTPGPHVKEMNDAGQFYTNRVLKEWKEKDATHVEWARAWIQTLTELQQYIKQHHTTGLVWSGKGGVPAGGAPPPPPMGACPPPPPPPVFDLAAMSLDGGGSADDRSALFAEINKGADITKNLKKVTADMQTHKNPTLRTGPAPFKSPTQYGAVGAPAASAAPAATVKAPVFARDGKKWLIEYQKNNSSLVVENAEMNNVVYMFKCEGSTLTVKGKVNNIVFDSCKKCSLLFDSVVASIEFVNCQSVQMQVLGFVPTVSIDKTDGCQMYLSKDSMGVEIVSSKSSEMNVLLPEANGDFTELAVPEQYKTTISGKALKTVCVDSLG